MAKSKRVSVTKEPVVAVELPRRTNHCAEATILGLSTEEVYT